MSAYVSNDREYRANDRERARLKRRLAEGRGNGATVAALERRNQAAARYREETGRPMGWEIV